MKIAIVNDVHSAVEALRRVIAAVPGYEVVWIARDGAEAVQRAGEVHPDIILMDLVMPVMDGVEATRRIMAKTPCAILVVTATVLGHAAQVFEALGAGALDAVTTPVLGSDGKSGGAQVLLAKIEQMHQMLAAQDRKQNIRGPVTLTGASQNVASPKQAGVDPSYRLVAIGASAGGPAALASILSTLTDDFPASIVIVQHVDPQFAPLMASWLSDQSTLPVRIAAEGDRPQTGRVLLAGTGDHLILRRDQTLGYTPDPIDYVYRPSVDTFFESVARHWKGMVTGVLLTGMGRDGALGLKALKDAGACTIVQSGATCAVFGMPKAAIEIGAAVEVLPLDQIAPALQKDFSLTSRSSWPSHTSSVPTGAGTQKAERKAIKTEI